MDETEHQSAANAPEPRPMTFAPNAVQMLRTVQSNTMSLSQMADQKASILMGATFVVFSLSVGRALTQTGQMSYSLIVLAVFAFLSALCGVSAVLPSIRKPLPGHENSANRLFFGHYAIRDEEEWTEDVLNDLQDEEAMFRMMLHDVYQNGQVLQRKKFKFLGYAYRLFIVGLFATIATFGIELSILY